MADIIEEIGDLVGDSEDKGEIRTVSQVYGEEGDIDTGEGSFTTDANGHIVVTVSDLISVEEDTAVLVDAQTDGDGGEDANYQPIDSGDDPIGAQSTLDAEGLTDISLEDNQVLLTFYNGAGAASTDATPPTFKIIARGY